ncbi:nuclear export factor GLE1 [Paenibacillus curdlanolyticus YK9]|uniref:Nuclear export factor GLE1 n=1 Tax=Paenibacillus curdlanolyticus YK9 TaxID=717606 RepID=E0I6H6_9BACL|nr:YcnI family protein [Paenibacillus curdlanolyticus]EFM11642.1 nuclear export factor GLE1 [Paenibacillus curdlanolyticus YK9]
MNMKIKMKKLAVAATMAVCLLMFAGIASAHVTVQPQEVPAGSYQVMSVRVPSEEKGTTTVKIQVKVPDQIKVSRVEPKVGWKYTLEKDAESKITSITWTADGTGLSETEFTDFRVNGKVADDAKELVWKAYQTYANGTLVEWVGGDGADKPASVTMVTAAEAGSDGHGHGSSAGAADNKSGDTSVSSGDTGKAETGTDSGSAGAAETAADTNANAGDDYNATLPLVLSIVAVALGAIALVISLTRKKR